MIWYLVINIFVILIFILLYFIIRRTDKKWSRINDYLGKVTSTVNSVRYGNLSTKIEKIDHPHYQNLSESINRMVETLNDREKMIVEYQGELTRQNKFLESVINSLSDGILIIDDSYKILRATPKISQWFASDGSQLMNKNIFDYVRIKDNIKIEKLDGSEIFIEKSPNRSFEANSMRLHLDDKKKRFVVLIKDITDQKELETLREDFVATLTHDLKVPIVAEANILEFLLDGKFGKVTERQKEAISNMKSCNNELLDLVQILLETYKIKETGIDLDKENLLLAKLIQSTIDEMQSIAEKSGFKITFDYKNDVKVFADRTQLKRVLTNLIQNAISHSDTIKDIDVRLGEIPGYATIKIIDYGKGIPEANIEKIFHKYYSTAKKFRKIGTGLGLYLSQQIVKSHGGEIIVKSEEGLSTEFCIKLPV